MPAPMLRTAGPFRLFRRPSSASIPAAAAVTQRLPEIPIPSDDFVPWARMTSFLCGTTGETPAPGADWRAWGREFVASPTMRVYGLPGPEAFEAWLDWALAVKRGFPGP